MYTPVTLNGILLKHPSRARAELGFGCPPAQYIVWGYRPPPHFVSREQRFIYLSMCAANPMTKTFLKEFNAVQPSQLYISSGESFGVMETFDSANPELIEPIPIKKLGNEIVLADGHTRAFAAFLRGFSEVPVYWEDEELDLDAYEICVRRCEENGVYNIGDQKNRVVSQEDYETVGHARYEGMRRGLVRRKIQQENKCPRQGSDKGGAVLKG